MLIPWMIVSVTDDQHSFRNFSRCFRCEQLTYLHPALTCEHRPLVGKSYKDGSEPLWRLAVLIALGRYKARIILTDYQQL